MKSVDQISHADEAFQSRISLLCLHMEILAHTFECESTVKHQHWLPCYPVVTVLSEVSILNPIPIVKSGFFSSQPILYFKSPFLLIYNSTVSRHSLSYPQLSYKKGFKHICCPIKISSNSPPKYKINKYNTITHILKT